MSFFSNQQRARRNTTILTIYFLAAVLLIMVGVNMVTFIAFNMGSHHPVSLANWLQSRIAIGIAIATVAVIGFGSLYRMAQLSGGGLSVAQMAGGMPVDPKTEDLKERTLINVTEEMSIASGTRVPRIFVMRGEAGINAFVAGTEPSNTVLVVTQGALDNLSREELQGVIGHEFSHILNGDMRMNIRLIGILAGILLISQIGLFLLRGTSYGYGSGYRRSSRSSRDSGGQIAVVGIALIVVGYVGLFFGRLIKAAISRQRELLADASSVQFTRNPDGIGGALYAISQLDAGSELGHRYAEDMSHMCFGETLQVGLSSMLATHPPIEERIKAIEPTLLPRLKARYRKKMQESGAANNMPPTAQPAGDNLEYAAVAGFAGGAPAGSWSMSDFSGATSAQQTTTDKLDVASIKASVGQASPAHGDYAHQLHASIPEPLLQAAHDPHRACAIICALVLTEMRSHGQEALQLISDRLGTECVNDVKAIYPQLRKSDHSHRLPLLDFALNSIMSLDAASQDLFISTSQELIHIDNRITLSEFIFSYLIRQTLNPPKQPVRSLKSFSSIESSLAILISAMVQISGETPDRQAKNFKEVMSSFTQGDYSTMLESMPGADHMTRALDQLNRLSPLLKQPVIDACVDCIMHDEEATIREMELLRAVCAALECPMPPIHVTLRSN